MLWLAKVAGPPPMAGSYRGQCRYGPIWDLAEIETLNPLRRNRVSVYFPRDAEWTGSLDGRPLAVS